MAKVSEALKLKDKKKVHLFNVPPNVCKINDYLGDTVISF